MIFGDLISRFTPILYQQKAEFIRPAVALMATYFSALKITVISSFYTNISVNELQKIYDIYVSQPNICSFAK